MKNLLFVSLILTASIQMQAQHENLSWFTDLSEAQSYAAENHTNILMVFAGSDWCKPCMQFKKDILLSDSFSKMVGKNVAVLYLDFPARKKNRLPADQTAKNEALAAKYNKNGAFPKIILIDKDENILAKPEFKGQSVEEFVQQINLSTSSK